jgi:hypothetical protein
MRPPKPSLNATYRANDGLRYVVQEVTDLPFVGEYQLVLASEEDLRNGIKVASITNSEFEVLLAAQGLQRITSAR